VTVVERKIRVDRLVARKDKLESVLPKANSNQDRPAIRIEGACV